MRIYDLFRAQYFKNGFMSIICKDVTKVADVLELLKIAKDYF